MISIALAATLIAGVKLAQASTYVVYVPLDSPIYQELDTLNGLGLLFSYVDTIKPFTLEETYEVLDAIDRRDWPGLAEELGDFMLQAVFYAQMAAERRAERTTVREHGCEDERRGSTQLGSAVRERAGAGALAPRRRAACGGGRRQRSLNR